MNFPLAPLAPPPKHPVYSVLQVVVKFLRKSGVLKDCWVNDKEMGLVAQEISLLARLSHPNIVMVCEFWHQSWDLKMCP